MSVASSDGFEACDASLKRILEDEDNDLADGTPFAAGDALKQHVGSPLKVRRVGNFGKTDEAAESQAAAELQVRCIHSFTLPVCPRERHIVIKHGVVHIQALFQRRASGMGIGVNKRPGVATPRGATQDPADQE